MKRFQLKKAQERPEKTAAVRPERRDFPRHLPVFMPVVPEPSAGRAGQQARLRGLAGEPLQPVSRRAGNFLTHLSLTCPGKGWRICGRPGGSGKSMPRGAPAEGLAVIYRAEYRNGQSSCQKSLQSSQPDTSEASGPCADTERNAAHAERQRPGAGGILLQDSPCPRRGIQETGQASAAVSAVLSISSFFWCAFPLP